MNKTRTRKRPPRDYRERPEVREAYEEGGRSIGRSIVHDPTKEEYYWKILGPLKMWPRWYLDAFRGLYADENPKEHQRAIKKRYDQKRARKRRLQCEQDTYRAANDRNLLSRRGFDPERGELPDDDQQTGGARSGA